MTKRILFYAIFATCILLLISCATGTNLKERNADGSPIWTTQIPSSSKLLYGVGKAKLTLQSNSERAADSIAMADLAKKISVNIKNATSQYSNDTASVVTNAFETIIIETTNVTMKGVVVEDRWTATDGTVWTIVSFRIKDLPKLYKDSANDYLNQLEEKRINTQNKLLQLIKEIGNESDSDSLAIKGAAEAKAAEIFSEIDLLTNSIDSKSLSDALEQYLKSAGYDLAD